jgi:hypothetical protein
MSQVFGFLAAKLILFIAQFDSTRDRPLTETERDFLKPIFHNSLQLDSIVIRVGVKGILNLSGRAYCIENLIFIPASYVPISDSLLLHEAVHAWQFQNSGHRYIGNSVWAQLKGGAYDITDISNTQWDQLNCEQQATLIECGVMNQLHENLIPSFQMALAALRNRQ